jgi:hypothetical protein
MPLRSNGASALRCTLLLFFFDRSSGMRHIGRNKREFAAALRRHAVAGIPISVHLDRSHSVSRETEIDRPEEFCKGLCRAAAFENMKFWMPWNSPRTSKNFCGS